MLLCHCLTFFKRTFLTISPTNCTVLKVFPTVRERCRVVAFARWFELASSLTRIARWCPAKRGFAPLDAFDALAALAVLFVLFADVGDTVPCFAVSEHFRSRFCYRHGTAKSCRKKITEDIAARSSGVGRARVVQHRLADCMPGITSGIKRCHHLFSKCMNVIILCANK